MFIYLGHGIHHDHEVHLGHQNLKHAEWLRRFSRCLRELLSLYLSDNKSNIFEKQKEIFTIVPIDSRLCCFFIIISNRCFSFTFSRCLVFINPNFWCTCFLIILFKEKTSIEITKKIISYFNHSNLTKYISELICSYTAW
jgi:hypothetical protein